MRRRARKQVKRWAAALQYRELEAGDILLDDDGQFYIVVELGGVRHWDNFGDVVEDFRIKGLSNTNTMFGNAVARHEVQTFDHRAWIWHSRRGCLIL